MDGESFRAYVEQCVVPILRPDDIVIIDNLPSHKVSGIREAIEGWLLVEQDKQEAEARGRLVQVTV